jgi:ABC-2 type transport system permease protein
MTAVTPTRRVSRLRIVARQVRYQCLLLLRSPSAPFFTFVVPLMLLVTLDLVYGSRSIPTRAGVKFPQFYLPAMTAFAMVNACYINVINGTTLARQTGMLKRIRGTPLPGWVYLSGRVGSACVVGLLSVTGVWVVSATLFDVQIVWGTLPGTLVLVGAGMACCSCIALALTPVVPTPDAALPIAYGTMLPLAFVSDVFFPSDTSPSWLQHLASAFPLRPLARSLADNLTPGASGAGFHWSALGTLAAWTAGAAVLLVFFRWDPAPMRRHWRRRHTVQSEAT